MSYSKKIKKFSIHTLLFCLLISFLYSCNSKKKVKQNVTIEKLNINDSLAFDNIKGKLFFSQPTNDSKFCDLSKIIETDCGVGYYYFNKQGLVTFTFECVGDTSIVYFLGSYKKSKNGINCHFDYSYECYFDTIGNQFRGKGKLVKEKDWFDIEVLVSTCPETYGYINEYEDSKDKEYYLIQRANKTQSETFWNFFRQSLVKKKYL